MNLSMFKNTYNGIRERNNFYKYSNLALSFAVVILVYALMNKEVLTIVMPPDVDETVMLTSKSASDTYKESWVLFAATLIGNVTPGTANFTAESFEKMLSPETWQLIRGTLSNQVDEIIKHHLTVSFTPKRTLYEKETDKYFIEGDGVVEEQGVDPVKVSRTYEFKLEIFNRRPVITYFDSYEGPARTAESIEKQEARQKKVSTK